MPYIPQFNKLSLQEMSYAPTLMRQQQDDVIAKQMELSEAMKFDYLKQDSAGLEPILQKYNTDIEDVSQQIAQNGFSHDLKSKVMGLRSQYIGDDKVRHYKKQYSDAMSQWDETRKRMIQEGRPGDDINRQKEQFFSAYTGGYDSEGKFKNDFTSGRTSGYYDIGEDATKLMTNLGSTETPIVGGNASIRKVVNSDGSSYYETKDFSRNGSITKNSDQILAIKQYLKAEYGNDKTDRGLFAKISKFDSSYIDQIVDQIGAAKTSYKKEVPLVNTGYGGFGSGSDTKNEESDPALLTYGNLKVNSNQYKEADERGRILSGEIKGTKTGINESIKGSEGYIGAENPFQISTTKVRSQEEVALDQNKRTPRYLDIFTNKTNPKTSKPYTDIEIAQIGVNAEKNAAAYVDKSTAMNIDKKSLAGQTAAQVVLLNMINPDNKTPLTQVGGKMFGGDKKISKAKFMELAGTDWENMPVQFYNNGDITITDFSGNKFKVNSRGDDNAGVLEDGTKRLYNEVYLPILNKLTAFNLYDDKNLDSPTQAPDGYLYDVVTPDGGDPYDVGHRFVRRSVVDPTSGERIQVGNLISPEQFKQDFLKQTASSSKNIQVK